jgi:hypothetical protein
MIRLDEIDPRIPRAGSPGRRIAIARLVVETVVGAALLLGSFYLFAVYGAAWS